MKSLGLGSVEDFPFLEPPPRRAIADGYQLLSELGAVDDVNELTPIGRELARLPLDPRVGRMILAARDRECADRGADHRRALRVQDRATGRSSSSRRPTRRTRSSTTRSPSSSAT